MIGGMIFYPGKAPFDKRIGLAAAIFALCDAFFLRPSITGFMAGAILRTGIAVKIGCSNGGGKQA